MTLLHAKRYLAGLAVLTAAAMLTACSGDSGGAAGGFNRPPTPVETATVDSRTVEDRFEAVGTIEADEAITIVSEIDGRVISIPFREGDYLSRGALIAQLDTAQLGAELRRARAVRDQRQASYDRIRSVVEQQAGAPQDLDDAAAALAVAEAELALARSRFDKTRITVPFAGMVGARRVSVGAFLRAGQPITDLADIDELRINFSAPERFLGQLRRGAAVTVSTPAFPGMELDGEIIVIEPLLDPETRSARVVARIRNSERRFRPGMSANIAAVLNRRTDALTVPSEAVFVSGNQAFVYVINADSTVARSPLVLGTRLSDAVEVVDGLAPGDRVVRAGHQKLFNGAKVMPVSSQPPADGGQEGGVR